MIRKFEEADIRQVMQIWLNGNVEAHPFIHKDYWEMNYPMVQEQLSEAEVYVFETNGEIQGFIGIVDAYIAGIFVDKKHRSVGVGKQLLEYAKSRYNSLSLGVYQQNKRAVEFYFREGFSVISEGMDEETGNAEYTMSWDADSLNEAGREIKKMKELKVFEMQQESTYCYTGITSFQNLLEVIRDYPFDAEVMEKAEIHKRNMTSPFSATLRLSPDAVIEETGEGMVFSFEDYDIRDGRSKCAAISLLESDCLEDNMVKLHIFVLEKEKMDLL